MPIAGASAAASIQSTSPLKDSALEGAVRADEAKFEAALKVIQPEWEVRKMGPDEVSTESSGFPKNGTFRYDFSDPVRRHDGYQVTVNGSELRIKETVNDISAIVVPAIPVDFKKAVQQLNARFKANRAATVEGKYLVQKGDTLFRLSREFNADLKKLNKLTSDTVEVGQKLNVPAKEY